METRREKADRFREHFSDLLKSIEAVSGPPVFRKVLILSLLDGLSRSVFPRHGNRLRFVELVRCFADWPEAEKVSLPHLARLLELTPDPVFEELRLWSKGQLKTWDFGRMNKCPISTDPDMEQVARRWPRGKEHRIPLAGVSLESLRHLNLLYQERNHLVHEFREAGAGMPLPSDTEPFYQEAVSYVYSLDDPVESIELVYPEAFLARLAERTLGKLHQYLVKNDLNPFSSYVFGSYWLPELNKP